MNVAFFVLALVTLAGAAAALYLRNLVHCALCLVLAFGGLGALMVVLGADFVGFAQVLVYVGSVAILIVFAILLTRRGAVVQDPRLSEDWIWGLGVALVVFGTIVGCVSFSDLLPQTATAAPRATVAQIGSRLMEHYVLPLELIALLLTAALIGAVVLARKEGDRA